MVNAQGSNWTVRGLTFVLWAVAAASAAYWGLKLGGASGSSVAVAPPARPVLQADAAAVARLLGQAAASPVASGGAAVPAAGARFQLVGVVAEGTQRGVALIGVDGRPAKPFRVGASVEGGLVLQSVRGRQAVLGEGVQGPARVTLEMPPPSASGSAGPAVPAALAPMPPPGGVPPPALALPGPR